MSPTRLLVPPLGVGLVAGGVAAMSAGGQAAAPPTGTLTLTVASNDNNGSFVDLPRPLGAALAGGGAPPLPAGAEPAAPPTGTLTLTVASNDNNGSFVDLPPKSRKAPSNGDEFFGRGTVTGDAQGTIDFSVTF